MRRRSVPGSFTQIERYLNIMNKKQLKNLLVALGILVGIAIVLSIVASLSG